MISDLKDLPNFSYEECEQILEVLNNSEINLVTVSKLSNLVTELSDKCRREVTCGNMRYRLFNDAVQAKGVDEGAGAWRFISSINPSHSALVSCISELQSKGEFLTELEVNNLKQAGS